MTNLQEPKKKRSLWRTLLGVFILLTVIGYFMPSDNSGDSDTSKNSSQLTIVPEPVLSWEEVSTETHTKGNGRKQLEVTLALTPDQNVEAKQPEIAYTVMHAAMDYQKKHGIPIVSVKLLSKRPTIVGGNDGMLALAVFIPDSKGYSGKQNLGPWDNLMAAERLLTKQELEYLRLWDELRGSYMVDDMLTIDGEIALDEEISKRMGVKPDSLKPFHNVMDKFEF